MYVKGENDEEEMMELRRGPWTVEEDFALMNYISEHGEGRWNSLASSAGLKRTGKSCRLRWLNYLRPDVRRGNISLQEQLLILELHSRWGNRWSKIAQHMPGRTDNEIKNYWRTRVQKHAKQLKCDVNSKQFVDTVRYLWMPILAEKIQAAAAATTTTSTSTETSNTTSNSATASTYNTIATTNIINNINSSSVSNHFETTTSYKHVQLLEPNYTFTPENSSTTTTTTASSSESLGLSSVSNLVDSCYNSCPTPIITTPDDYFQANCNQLGFTESLISPVGYHNQGLSFPDIDQNNHWTNGTEDSSDNLWNIADIWY